MTLLTFKEVCAESLNSTVPWEWRKETLGTDRIEAHFFISDIEYDCGFQKIDPIVRTAYSSDAWSFSFMPSDLSLKKLGLSVSQAFDVIDTGSQFAVFSTVITIVKDFLKKYKPKVVRFTAKEPSRIRLYDRFITMANSQLPDYTGVSIDNGDYQLIRSRQAA